MKRTRVIMEEMYCDSPAECEGVGPTPYPTDFSNSIGEYCLDQSPCNKTSEHDVTCRYLKWRFVREIDASKIDVTEKGRL